MLDIARIKQIFRHFGLTQKDGMELRVTQLMAYDQVLGYDEEKKAAEEEVLSGAKEAEKENSALAGLTEGRMVHYVLPDDANNSGDHRPAVIVRVWKNVGYPEGTVNMLVFTDSFNDNKEGNQVEWHTSVHYDPDGRAGTWHWIERAG